MGKDARDYDAFQIFEQIQGQEETVSAQPLPLPRQRPQSAPGKQPEPALTSWPESSPEPQPFAQLEPMSEFQPQQLSFIQPELVLPEPESQFRSSARSEAFLKSDSLSQPIPQRQLLSSEPGKPQDATSTAKHARQQTFREETPYYEIEYDSCPMPGVGRFVLKSVESAKIETPPQERDQIRELFNQMRDIARESRSLYFSNTKFYDRKIQQENSRIFYLQGMFMKGFEDTCEKVLPYSAYFPNYQMMGYGQLRTYFTWRTQVRQGNIQQTSLSYAFLYIYELLNNIGVDSPRDGLDRLMLFWDAYRVYDQSIDKYVLKWLKDYHIYYELPVSFHQFIEENGLGAHYPNLSNPEDRFDLCCAISKYDIRKSKFYTEDRKDLVRECFSFLYARLQQVFAESRMDLDKAIFQPAKHMSPWLPFKEALFYPALQQTDRQVVLSEKEIYLCAGNQWTFSASITTESGKQLLGYAFRQMESVLRDLTKYRHKLTAGAYSLSPMTAEELREAGISLETVITKAVTEFYREATRTVVRVDQSALDRIREESLATQEKLVVPDQETLAESVYPGLQNRPALDGRELAAGDFTGDGSSSGTAEAFTIARLSGAGKTECETDGINGGNPENHAAESAAEDKENLASNIVESDINNADSRKINSDIRQEEEPSPWKGLREALTDTEKEALALSLNGKTNIKHFADAHGIMLEVLMDGINEKSMDCIGDSLLDDEFTIYDDYREQVKGMVETI